MIPVEAVEIVYVNWRGEQAVRSIVPMRIHFGTSPWHAEPQWLLHAQDLDKGVDRVIRIGAPDRRAVQRSLLNVIESIDLRPPKAAARRSCGIVSV